MRTIAISGLVALATVLGGVAIPATAMAQPTSGVRSTGAVAARAASPPSSAPAPVAAAPPPSAQSGPPTPLDGTYRLEVERSKETFDYTPSPQPPDVTTWWAFRSSCTPSYCSAATCVAAGTNVLAHVALPVKKVKQKPKGIGI